MNGSESDAVLSPAARALWIGLGAAVGANLRWLLATWLDPRLGQGIPWGTFFVNAVGSLLIGIVLGALEGRPTHPRWEPTLVVGLLGGFTTFSSFSAQNLALLREDRFGHFLAYSLLSVFVGLLLAGIGYEAVRRFASA